MSVKENLVKILLALGLSFGVVFALSKTVFFSYTPDLRVNLDFLKKRLDLKKKDKVEKIQLQEGVEALKIGEKMIITQYQLNEGNFEVAGEEGKVFIIGTPEDRQIIKDVLNIK